MHLSGGGGGGVPGAGDGGETSNWWGGQSISAHVNIPKTKLCCMDCTRTMIQCMSF